MVRTRIKLITLYGMACGNVEGVQDVGPRKLDFEVYWCTSQQQQYQWLGLCSIDVHVLTRWVGIIRRSPITMNNLHVRYIYFSL